MNYKVIVSCPVTGSGDAAGKHPDLPITPKQIADAFIKVEELIDITVLLMLLNKSSDGKNAGKQL